MSLIHPTFSSKCSTLTVFLGPGFSTQTPKQDCNFETLAPTDTDRADGQDSASVCTCQTDPQWSEGEGKGESVDSIGIRVLLSYEALHLAALSRV